MREGVQDVNGVSQPIYDVIFTTDGSKLIATAGSEILIYNASEGDLIKALKAHKDSVICLAPLLGDGFASGGADKQVIIWSNTFQGTLKYSHGDTIQSISQNPVTGVVLSCTGSDFGLWTPDVKAVPKTKVPSRIVCSAWSPDGQQFALGLYNGHVSIRLSTGEEQVRIERGVSPIWSIAWSTAPDLDSNILAVADWSQKLSFFELSGRQLGKDRNLGFDPCSISYFNSGEYLLVGGSNKQVNLWTTDGIQIGPICKKEGWIWACKSRPNLPFVAVGSADGTISVFQIQFNTVHGLYDDRYAFRQNMTDIVIQHLTSNQRARIKCRDYVKKIAIYKESLAVQLSEKVVVYELFHDEQGDMHYRIKEKVMKALECNLLVVTSNHILLCNDSTLQLLSFTGENEHQWTFESMIRYIKVAGGPKGKEGLLVGLKDGNVFKIFVDNPFPVPLIKHNLAIRCLDINLTRKKLAIVDEQSTCLVFDLQTKEILFQEPNANSVAWNSELEDSICFSGNNLLNVRINKLVVHQQQMQGFVVGFKGSKVFSLNVYQMAILNIPQTFAIDSYLDSGDYKSAHRIACLGVPESDWRRLAISAMEQFVLDIAKRAFVRIKDFKFLEVIRVIERMKKDGRKETDLFLAEVYAFSENFVEAAKLFKKSGNIQKAIEMYTELNLWENATQLAEETHEDTQDILKRKAQMQEDRKDILAAAATYEQVGNFKQAIELLGSGGYTEKLMEIVKKLKTSDSENLSRCVTFFRKENNLPYAIETMKKIGDISSLLYLYIEIQQWDDAFKIGESNPEFSEQIYLPYGNWLALNDRFDEAQLYYTKAGRSDEAIRVLKILAENSIVQQKYKDGGYYYWCLSKETLNSHTKRMAISQKDVKENPFKKWKVYHELAELYYAYNQIHSYIEDPFTFALPETLLNTAKYILVNIYNKQSPPGISKIKVLYCMAKISFSLGCFKLCRFAYEKLMTMKLPAEWQDTVDLATMAIRAKPFTDKEEFSPTCYQCSTLNQTFNTKEAACTNCLEPFVPSFYSFENLPLVRFAPAPDIPTNEVNSLILQTPAKKKQLYGPGSNEDIVSALTATLDRSGIDGLKAVQFDRNQLLNLDHRMVFVRQWPNASNSKEYYLLKNPETPVALCDSCQHFFLEDEWQYQLLIEGKCPFCRTKY
ncbi:hypothetical protein HDV02_005419 [Globomyces sp. JEL0801]|nr:hypothetical protein HDV02_005419 [Globomyces sp. JEL0801]